LVVPRNSGDPAARKCQKAKGPEKLLMRERLIREFKSCGAGTVKKVSGATQ